MVIVDQAFLGWAVLVLAVLIIYIIINRCFPGVDWLFTPCQATAIACIFYFTIFSVMYWTTLIGSYVYKGVMFLSGWVELMLQSLF